MSFPADDALGIALLEALEESQVFAVVDAAHFEFLQDTLIGERLSFDPLYLDEIDAPTIASGPHLVKVTGPSQIKKIREIIGDKAACVWWAWPNEPNASESIFRHLRGINMVEIPKDRYDSDAKDRGRGFDAVLFRHADPAIVSLLLRVMTDEQRARFLGKADAVILCTPDLSVDEKHPLAETWEVDQISNDLTSADESRSLIRFTHPQYEQVGGFHRTLQYRRIARSLRPSYPNEAEDKYIDQTIAAFERAVGYGAVELDDLGTFVELDLLHGPRFEIGNAQAMAMLGDSTRLIGSRLRELPWVIDPETQEAG